LKTRRQTAVVRAEVPVAVAVIVTALSTALARLTLRPLALTDRMEQIV